MQQPVKTTTAAEEPIRPVPEAVVQNDVHSIRLFLSEIFRIVSSQLFGRIYAVAAAGILLATTIFWSILGAQLNQQNADQLVNPLLFENSNTFHEALLPGSHSFFLKWPLFYLVKIFGFGPNAYISVTVVTVVLTVAALAFLVYRIDKRPIVFGTILLALSSILLLIPATAYPGALLPVNMAMLATRNIEYVMFIVGVFLFIKSRRVWSVSFGLGVVVLALVMASDKLYVTLSVVGAGIAMLVYGLFSGWNLVSTSARWLLGSLLAAVGGILVLWILGGHATHLVGQAGLGPYGFTKSAHDVMLASIYAGLHILTNFGANPASQTIVLRNVPHDAQHGLLSLAGPGYALNLAVFLFSVFAGIKIILSSLAHNKDRKLWLGHPAKLSSTLIFITLAAGVVFVGSNHYYAADARYLGIAMFSLCICAATYLSRNIYSSTKMLAIGGILFVGIILAIPHVLSNYHTSQAALSPFLTRNQRVAAALAEHPVKTLLGDYWRVIPIKSVKPVQNVVPLASCTTPRNILSSHVWDKDLAKTQFAYLYSLDPGLTDYPRCNLNQIIAAYGHPNGSIIIDGSIEHPKELLLFYDNGAQKSAPITKLPGVSTVQPAELDELPSTSCRQQTIMNIVAHEDDDLLFINPDTSRDLHAGNCVRTVYVTSGDAGQNSFYWLSRERASQAAYGHMLGHTDIWVERVVHLKNNLYVTIANPRGNNKVSLIYMHLPDGNIRGQGFNSHKYESLESLVAGKISNIHDIYNDSAYSASDIENTLASFMQTYQPTEVRTQAHVGGGKYPDHSDHLAVGTLAQKAYQQYETEHFAGQVVIPIKFYIGYPVHNFPVNLNPNERAQKEQVFSIYSQYDSSVCHSITLCRDDPAYGTYLTRQYQNPF